MNGSKVGSISIPGMGQRMDWPKSRFNAVRDIGSEYLDITMPAGPKTEKTLGLRLKLSELRALVEWMEAG